MKRKQDVSFALIPFIPYNIELSSNEQIVLATTCLDKEVPNRRLQAILNLHPADIGELLGTMADKKNLLKKNFKGRWTTYTLNIDAQPDNLSTFSQSLQEKTIVDDRSTAQVTAQVCDICKEPSSAKEIMSRLGLKHWKNFQERVLKPLLAANIIERTQPDSPRSPTQKYRLTDKGKEILASSQEP